MSAAAYSIYMTFGERDEAESVARALVVERLAACANVLGAARSFYCWEGEVQADDEVVVLAKTRAALVDQVVARVRELHSYDCPCVVALPIEAGNPDYLAWIERETSADFRPLQVSGQGLIERFDHIVLTVADLAATIEFYERALGMTARAFSSDGVERWSLHFGGSKINLHQVGAEFEPKAAAALPGSGDICLTSRRPVAELKAELADAGIEVIEGPVARSGARGALNSIYLRDPDGNLIEIANEV